MAEWTRHPLAPRLWAACRCRLDRLGQSRYRGPVQRGATDRPVPAPRLPGNAGTIRAGTAKSPPGCPPSRGDDADRVQHANDNMTGSGPAGPLGGPRGWCASPLARVFTHCHRRLRQGAQSSGGRMRVQGAAEVRGVGGLMAARGAWMIVRQVGSAELRKASALDVLRVARVVAGRIPRP